MCKMGLAAHHAVIHSNCLCLGSEETSKAVMKVWEYSMIFLTSMPWSLLVGTTNILCSF